MAVKVSSPYGAHVRVWANPGEETLLSSCAVSGQIQIRRTPLPRWLFDKSHLFGRIAGIA